VRVSVTRQAEPKGEPAHDVGLLEASTLERNRDGEGGSDAAVPRDQSGLTWHLADTHNSAGLQAASANAVWRVIADRRRFER
jgi:hypothetical protein